MGKTFTYVCRGRSGAPESGVVEAESRKAALDELRRRGIAPISLEEGVAAAAARPPSRAKGLVAGLLVVAVGCGVAWWLGGRMGAHAEPRAPREEPAKRPAPPAKVKPKASAVPLIVTNAVKRAPAPPPAKPAEPSTDRPPPKVRRTITGRPIRLVTNSVSQVRAAYHVFKARSDNHLATYLTSPFGTMFVGEFTYDERFLEDFKASLEEPIQIEPDDSDEVRQVKEAVAAAKAELKRRHEAGEDVCAIFQQTRDELQQLGRYRLTLESQLREIQQDRTMTDKDVADFVSAANEMLEEKGIAPLELSSFTREVLKDSAGLREEEEER